MSGTVYIVISQTGTILSRILKVLTGAKYNHASISLVPDLETMYSFGRVHPYNPVLGGFVTESPNRGTFKRFSKTKATILSISVTDEQYRALKEKLESMQENKKRYHYNYIGLFLAGVRIPYHQKRCYYCSEFVKEMLVRQGIRGADQLASIVEPIHFLQLPDANYVYSGSLKAYAESCNKDVQ
ncbi:MAG: hypothetical protein IJD70_10420 [Clostridia bacterium]|nr:hypothetical protein [Clostridia bacterium]